MGESSNVGMMLKIKRTFSRGSKRSNAPRQNISILMRQRKDKINRMETQFSASHPPAPRTRSFLRNDFPSKQTLSASNNVSIIKGLTACLVYRRSLFFKDSKKRKIIKNFKESQFFN